MEDYSDVAKRLLELFETIEEGINHIASDPLLENDQLKEDIFDAIEVVSSASQPIFEENGISEETRSKIHDALLTFKTILGTNYYQEDMNSALTAVFYTWRNQTETVIKQYVSAQILHKWR